MKDLIIIGAGPGGYELALEASRLGLSVILIERDKLGGTCLNHGCIPTKSYYQNALVLKDLKEKEVYGISGDFTFDFKKVKERKDNVVETLCKGIEFSFSKSSVELVYGKASFVDQNTVLVNDITYTAKNIVIATGSSPIRNLFEGSNLEGVLTSEELLDLETLPKELVIIGGGVIGIEMATIFNSFGVKVEVIEMCDRILPLIDSDISKRLQSYLKSLGIGIHTKSSLQKIEKSEGKLKAIFTEKGKESSLLCENVLVSVGRIANVNGLDLEKVNIEFTKKGILVNENYQTNIPNIYAIGDVTGKMMLAHSATYSGYRVLNHILGKKDNINFSLVPSCVFTFPEVASIGLTKEDIEKEELEAKIIKVLYRSVGKAVAMNHEDGFLKLIISENKIIGAHILGYDASTLIHELVPLMNEDISIERIKDYIHAHPTLSEILSIALKEL